jgi:hypothetical protein
MLPTVGVPLATDTVIVVVPETQLAVSATVAVMTEEPAPTTDTTAIETVTTLVFADEYVMAPSLDTVGATSANDASAAKPNTFEMPVA